MDIIIRNLDGVLVAKLDKAVKQFSKRTGRMTSRNEFIKIIIEKSMVQDMLVEEHLQINEMKNILQEYVDTNHFIIQTLLPDEVQAEENMGLQDNYSN